MRRFATACCLLAVTLASLPASAENGLFSGHRADTVAEGRFEFGIIEHSRYGLTRDLELYAHPLFFFAVPHLGAKVAWSDSDTWRISTRHEIAYPSFGLGFVSGEGAGGFLPADQVIPQLVTIDNEVVMTMTIPLTQRFVTVGVGVEVAPRFSGPPVLIEAPLFFPRSAAYSSGIVGHARFDFSGEIGWDMTFQISAKGYFMPDINGFAVEQQAFVAWQPSDSWKLRGGAIISTGWYPFGIREHRIPLADFLFTF